MLNPIDETAAVTAAVITGQPAITNGLMTMTQLMVCSPGGVCRNRCAARFVHLESSKSISASSNLNLSPHLRRSRGDRAGCGPGAALGPASQPAQLFAHRLGQRHRLAEAVEQRLGVELDVIAERIEQTRHDGLL